MEIETDLNRGDFLAQQLYLVPRLKFTWIMLGSLWFLLSVTSIRRGNIAASPLALIASSLFIAFGFFLVFYLLYLVFAMFTARRNGIIGRYVYRIGETGFSVAAGDKENATPWHDIGRIARTKNALYVGISWHRYHIIPRRFFRDDAQYDACWRLLRQYTGQNS